MTNQEIELEQGQEGCPVEKKRSMRRAINEMCKNCVYDPKSGLGTWRQQTEACTITRCPLWDYRPLADKRDRKGESNENCTMV